MDGRSYGFGKGNYCVAWFVRWLHWDEEGIVVDLECEEERRGLTTGLAASEARRLAALLALREVKEDFWGNE